MAETTSKRKSSRKKTVAKADHKHEWEKVILREEFKPLYSKHSSYTFSAGRRCTVCGKLSIGFEPHGINFVSDWVPVTVDGVTYNQCVIKPEYQDLPVIHVKSIFDMKDGGEVVSDT